MVRFDGGQTNATHPSLPPLDYINGPLYLSPPANPGGVWTLFLARWACLAGGFLAKSNLNQAAEARVAVNLNLTARRCAHMSHFSDPHPHAIKVPLFPTPPTAQAHPECVFVRAKTMINATPFRHPSNISLTFPAIKHPKPCRNFQVLQDFNILILETEASLASRYQNNSNVEIQSATLPFSFIKFNFATLDSPKKSKIVIESGPVPYVYAKILNLSQSGPA
ncbi:hypothetical protein C8F04DRAFT_1199871 [Mycena alexandri]|uniref:Uncharacterized protein n=1 Tax=Mycena alexandri TaxID=1745969 RepID=A0AAD6WKZ8_9AGAR|nr:hypothetical protein C8F04DRAFT_1199871 [Mycena alexandri]